MNSFRTKTMIPPPPFKILSLRKGVWKPLLLNALDSLCSLSLLSHIPNTCKFLFSEEVSIRLISENLLISLPHIPWTFKNPILIPFFLRFRFIDETELLLLLVLHTEWLIVSVLGYALKIILQDSSLYASEIKLSQSLTSLSSLGYKISVQVQLNELHSTHRVDKHW